MSRQISSLRSEVFLFAFCSSSWSTLGIVSSVVVVSLAVKLTGHTDLAVVNSFSFSYRHGVFKLIALEHQRWKVK